MKVFRNVSLRNKIFFTSLAVVLLISVTIAFLARWILVSSLTSELEHRGTAIAQSIAEQARGYILDKDTARLVTLLFDTAFLGERKDLVAYIYVAGTDGEVLAHTYTRPFPEGLAAANVIGQGEKQAIRPLLVLGQPAYDIAVPVTEGIYQIGAVHVGLNKRHIDNLVGKLRITFLGFISLIIVIIFIISLRLANYVTLPIRRLTRMSDELSRGNFEITMELDDKLKDWAPQRCPAYQNTDLPCWHFDQTLDQEARQGRSAENLRTCRECMFYQKHEGDEVKQLADSFRNMVWSIKLYRRRLQESEEKYRSLFDSGPDPILVVDYPSLKILDANPRAEELYGYDKDELLGQSFRNLDPDYENQCKARFQESGDVGACVYCTKVLHYKKGKEPFYVNLHACPITYKGYQSLIIATADITEMIEKDAQLIQASKMKTLGEMSAGIAHEINQPLNAIKMGSDFLSMVAQEDGAVPTEHLRQVSEEISAQVDRATEIINTLRAFGRKADLIKERLDVNTSIRGVMNIVGQQLKLQNIDVRLDLTPRLPAISAHDNRLQQVLFNLVTNARDAIAGRTSPSEGGEHIDIRSYAEDGQVAIEVGDSGAGIPEAERDKIFEPFFTTKETGQGMGLGLSISYGIVKDYHGDIRIQSLPGKGTTFKLTFPALAV
jgi:histidine kinase